MVAGFGAIAQTVLTIVLQSAHNYDPIWAFENAGWLQMLGSALGFIATLWFSMKWRKKWAAGVAEQLRLKEVSFADRNLTAWETVVGRESAKPQNIFIKTINGDCYACDELHLFKTEFFGSCILGNDGSVGMYVTSVKEKNDAEWTDVDPHLKGWGPEFRIFAKEQIAEVRMRHGT